MHKNEAAAHWKDFHMRQVETPVKFILPEP